MIGFAQFRRGYAVVVEHDPRPTACQRGQQVEQRDENAERHRIGQARGEQHGRGDGAAQQAGQQVARNEAPDDA